MEKKYDVTVEQRDTGKWYVLVVPQASGVRFNSSEAFNSLAEACQQVAEEIERDIEHP